MTRPAAPESPLRVLACHGFVIWVLGSDVLPEMRITMRVPVARELAIALRRCAIQARRQHQLTVDVCPKCHAQDHYIPQPLGERP